MKRSLFCKHSTRHFDDSFSMRNSLFLTAWETVVSQESFIIDVSGRRFCIVLVSEFRMWLGIILSNEWHYLHFISFHFISWDRRVRSLSFRQSVSSASVSSSRNSPVAFLDLSLYLELWVLTSNFSRLDSFASRLWKENLREENAAMQCDLRFAAMFYIGICQYSEVTQFRVSTAIEESTSSFMMFQMVIFLFI